MAPTAEGLAGKIIGVQASTIHEAYVTKYFAPTAAEVKVYQTQDEANQDWPPAGSMRCRPTASRSMPSLPPKPALLRCELKGAVADDHQDVVNVISRTQKQGMDWVP